MQKLVAALVVVLAVLVPGTAGAKLIVGVNDDVKYESAQPAFFMPTMQADGLKMNALTMRWDDSQPTTVDSDLATYISTVVTAAQNAGVTVELDLYPLHSQSLTGGRKCTPSTNPLSCGDATRIAQFGAWVGAVARTFPSVHQFIVMN